MPTKIGRAHRILIGVVVAGAAVIAGIGFAGSYAAVRELALKKGFGSFAYFFPIGIDAGICVLLALDLLLTWIRMPFPLLRQTAWLLTVATVAFNGAAAWPDMLGVGMHAVIPVLFVVTVEAARHAVGRIADITADKHMEGVRITRWLLAPVPTFLLWRRMKLWELRSYDAVIKLEQERLVYQARLRSRFGRAWRRKAPVESLMPLRLARYGVPLAETAPAGLAAAGIEQQLLPAPRPPVTPALEPTAQEPAGVDAEAGAEELPSQWFAAPQQVTHGGNYDPAFVPEQEHGAAHDEHQVPARERVPVPALRAPEPEQQAPAPSDADVVDPKPEPEQWQVSGTGQPSYSGVAEHESASPAPAPTAPLPEPVATASATGGQGARHPVSSAIGQGATGQTAVAASARPSTIPPARVPDTTGQSGLWETASQDTGEATARKLQAEQQELDPEEQRIEQVVQWLIEAEATGKKLSGAEVARRLEVAPRTGQRAVAAAKEVKEARERQQGRSHLRSVTHRI
ncbi:DUF2637 domain-containing protein [Streptomyces platensis]|uniref:DUF2637 domain-containing protein n=1 Tax=Streptomyces platensis TaxID=58346 RepID=UPI001F406621|nr:DUF2637 domain-containing protein [Streptomyces platensis]MCF3143672.1 DUF2637 domain-containing protein [Streptomyces platensis]